MRQRLSSRYEVGNQFGHLDWELPADLCNISLGGMAMRLDTSLAPGTVVYVELLQQGQGILGLDATTSWCRPFAGERSGTSESERPYKVGVRFSGPLAERSQSLMEFNGSNRIVRVQRGTFGRFVLDYSRPILVRSTCQFRLKLLSYSGMLVETSVSLARNSRIDLSIPLGREDFLARGRVADVSPGDEEDLPYRLGIGFEELGETRHPVLRDFIEGRLASAPLARSRPKPI